MKYINSVRCRIFNDHNLNIFFNNYDYDDYYIINVCHYILSILTMKLIS